MEDEKVKTQYRIDVIADDLTGAMDTGVQFSRVGLDTILLLRSQEESQIPVHVINTRSRDVDLPTARTRMGKAEALCRPGFVFKKIDSTMRGHIGLEIEAILKWTGLQKAVVCPAVTHAGRIIRDGNLWVDDQLLDHTAFAADPHWPARTARMAELTGLPTTHIMLDQVRAGPEVLLKAIASTPTQVVTVDAVTDADLSIISRAIIVGQWLPCGALGLASAWIETLVGRPDGSRTFTLKPENRPVVAVVGSRHPKTLAQVNKLAACHGVKRIELNATLLGEWEQLWQQVIETLAAGRSLVIQTPRHEIIQLDQLQAIEDVLGNLTRSICRNFVLGGLILTGGATAWDVCQALETTAVRILDELEVGMPWGRLLDGIAAELPVVTKAGGFGDRDSLVTAFEALSPVGLGEEAILAL